MRISLLFLMMFQANWYAEVYGNTFQQTNTILISEVLFNPRPGGVDFVEIYNSSGNILDLKAFSIASINEKDSIVAIKPLSKSPLLFLPGAYLVLTTDPENIKKEYTAKNPGAFLKMTSMPSFNDDAGVAVLLQGNIRSDQLNYTAKMHFPLIKDPEGVSLERSSFKLRSNESGNFRSAAGTAGYATPGYVNSQVQDEKYSGEDIYLSSRTFSPDNDGFEDALQLNYRFGSGGRVLNAIIYNDRGVLIHKLARNLTLSSEGILVWNGLNGMNEKQATGIYTLYMEVFDLSGKVQKYRKNFVLAARL